MDVARRVAIGVAETIEVLAALKNMAGWNEDSALMVQLLEIAIERLNQMDDAVQDAAKEAAPF